MAKRILIFLLASGLWCAMALAQDVMIIGSDDTTEVEPDSEDISPSPARHSDDTLAYSRLLEWSDWWQRSLGYLKLDSTELALAATESCLVRARDLDIRLPAQGSLLAGQAELNLRAGRLAQAQRFSSLALAANPSSFEAILSDLRAKARSSGKGYSLGVAIQNVSRAIKDFPVSLKVTSHLLIWAWLALTACGTMFMAFLAIKYLPALLHLMSEQLPRAVPIMARQISAGAIVLALVLTAAVFSLPLAIGLLAVFISTLASARERAFLIVSIALVLLASIGLSMAHHMWRRIDQGYLLRLAAANNASWSQDLSDELAADQQAHPHDLKPMLSLALLSRRSGNWETARQYYQALLDAKPDNAQALNNLGNIHFSRAQYDTAQELYTKAIAAEPGLAVAHYNLGQVHLRFLRFTEARKELERAAALGPREIDARASQGAGGIVMDALFPPQLLWRGVWEGWWFYRGFSRSEAVTLSGAWMWTPAAGALVLAALLALWLATMRGRLASDGCAICGKSTCRRCRTESPQGEPYCPGCAEKILAVQSQELQDKVAASLKPQRAKRLLQLGSIGNLAAPGAGFVLADSTLVGWLWALLWGLAYATWRTWALGLHPGAAAGAMLGAAAGWALVGLAALLWLLSWLGVLALNKD